MRGIKQFLSPTSIDEALKLLDQHRENAVILAGGTHLSLVKSSSKEIMIDIKGVDLDYVKEENDYIRVGAATKIAELIENPIIREIASSLIQEASLKVGSPLTRNLVTIGGNLCSPFPWSNLPPALLVLDAEVELSSSNNTRIMKLSEFLAGNPKKVLANNELLTSTLIPKSSCKKKSAYLTFNTTENDYDMVMVAVALDLNDTLCSNVRVAVGAAVSPAALIESVNAFIESKELTDSNILAASEKALDGISLVKDFRTSDEHRKQVVKTFVKRALESIRG